MRDFHGFHIPTANGRGWPASAACVTSIGLSGRGLNHGMRKRPQTDQGNSAYSGERLQARLLPHHRENLIPVEKNLLLGSNCPPEMNSTLCVGAGTDEVFHARVDATRARPT